MRFVLGIAAACFIAWIRAAPTLCAHSLKRGHSLSSLQINVYEVAGSRYAELPSELYDVALSYIADATANAQPEQLERALGALTAAARATPPGATGQVGRAVDSGLFWVMRGKQGRMVELRLLVVACNPPSHLHLFCDSSGGRQRAAPVGRAPRHR